MKKFLENPNGILEENREAIFEEVATSFLQEQGTNQCYLGLVAPSVCKYWSYNFLY